MLKILLIEDEKPFAEFMSEMFQRIGAKIEIAHTWAQAVEKLKLHPNIVTFDIILPDSGLLQAEERLAYIRQACPEASIMIVSGIDPSQVKEISEGSGIPSVEKSLVPTGNILYDEVRNALTGKSGLEENLALLEKYSKGLKS